MRFSIKMMCVLFSSISYFSLSLSAQDLPNYMTPQEQTQMKSYLNSIETRGFTNPPASKVRAAAEWEEVQTLTIKWLSYTTVLREIVRNAVLECKVIIVCSDSNSVKTTLTGAGISLQNVSFVAQRTGTGNSVWIRDYMANTVYTNDVDSLLLVDWIYNRPRPQDDATPIDIAAKMNIPLYQMTNAPYALTTPGGNFIPDGFGKAFSSKLILDENTGSTEAQIDTMIKKFMGIEKYVKFQTLPYDGIHHIDMHIKLLDEETMLVGQYPTGIADGPQIEANIQYLLSNCNSVFGTPYKIVRIPMPPDGTAWPSGSGDYLTFTNGVFVNKTYIFPTYYEQYDTVAYRIYRENLPGYKIVGINCNQTIPSSGAIHCITHAVGTNNPLLISHQRLQDTYNTTTPYIVNAKMMHRSGIQTAKVYYTTDTLQPWSNVSMSITDVINNIWTGNIPAQQAGKTVYYYVEANSVSGKTQVRPITAPTGYWKFKVLGTSTSNNETVVETIIKSIYPNPASAITCVPIVNSENQQADISLFNMVGEKVETIFNGNLPVGERNFFFDARNYSSGVYFVKFASEKDIFTQKIIVK
ncbi:MAG: agmatine deiminase family protein [Bacteroidota bacterium]